MEEKEGLTLTVYQCRDRSYLDHGEFTGQIESLSKFCRVQAMLQKKISRWSANCVKEESQFGWRAVSRRGFEIFLGGSQVPL